MKLIAIKNLILPTVFFVICQMAFAQQPQPPAEPKFMGDGLQRFYQFINNEIDFSKVAGEETMKVAFSLDETGKLNNLSIADFKKQTAGDEIRRVLMKAPKWDMSNQNPKYLPGYRMNLIFEKNKVKGTTTTVWTKKESIADLINEPVGNPPKSSTAAEGSDPVYDLAGIERKPEYPGGLDEFYAYIGKEFRVPKKGLQGKIFVTFVVEKDGSLTDIKVLRDIGYGTGEEAIRVLKESKKWSPGMQNGKNVRVLYALPISLQIR